ncbi:hypothetical protein HNR46_001729 [Haloferula luteola]|uniref:Uncharacterized protein n=1 Tax=Haloferula luteola TaxID=595692 RepID=A0A840V0G5_9BACT|nr:hypothetical protein [Haloferula luteola]
MAHFTTVHESCESPTFGSLTAGRSRLRKAADPLSEEEDGEKWRCLLGGRKELLSEVLAALGIVLVEDKTERLEFKTR